MTIKESIIEIFKMNDNSPMDYLEIYSFNKEHGIKEIGGYTPEKSISTILTTNPKTFKKLNKVSGKSKFILIDYKKNEDIINNIVVNNENDNIKDLPIKPEKSKQYSYIKTINDFNLKSLIAHILFYNPNINVKQICKILKKNNIKESKGRIRNVLLENYVQNKIFKSTYENWDDYYSLNDNLPEKYFNDIIDIDEILNNIKNNILNEQIKKIYEVSYTISESRGKKRQNIINDVVIEYLKQDKTYDGCKFKTEVRIDKSKITWGEYFTVDICVYKDDILIEIILNKAPASNIIQNKVNSIDKINSEITRLSKIENIKITFINFLPKISPFFTRDESIKKFENNKPFFLSKVGIQYKLDFDEIYITFEIDNLDKCVSKVDVKNLFYMNNPIKNVKVEKSSYKRLS